MAPLPKAVEEKKFKFPSQIKNLNPGLKKKKVVSNKHESKDSLKKKKRI